MLEFSVPLATMGEHLAGIARREDTDLIDLMIKFRTDGPSEFLCTTTSTRPPKTPQCFAHKLGRNWAVVHSGQGLTRELEDVEHVR